VCIISAAGPLGAQAMPVRYRNCGLEVECLVPRWAEVAYHLEQGATVVLIAQACHVAGPSTGSGQALHWLQIRGSARAVTVSDWAGLLPEWTSGVAPEELYLVVRVTPARIDLFDESQGWGARETLELSTPQPGRA